MRSDVATEQQLSDLVREFQAARAEMNEPSARRALQGAYPGTTPRRVAQPCAIVKGARRAGPTTAPWRALAAFQAKRKGAGVSANPRILW